MNATSWQGLTLRTLDDAELDALSAACPEGGFQQTSAMRRLAEAEGYRTDIVGIVDPARGETPLAGAMVVYTPSRFGWEGSVWLGPLCDPHDKRLVGALSEAIRRSAKRHHAYAVSCWPDDVYQCHASNGVPLGEGDEAMMRGYAAAGWRHGGFTRGYGSLINNWVYVKDLSGFASPKELLASYTKNTRRNVKIASNSAVEVRRLGFDELDTFHRICELSSRKQHFRNRDIEYFRRVYRLFGDDAEFMVAEIHLDRYLAGWRDKLAKFGDEAARLERSLQTTNYPDDVRRKLATAQSNVESAHRRIEDAQMRIERDGMVVPAAVGLFMWHRRELVYFSSGSDERYAKFYAPTAIQHAMMSRCLERGVTRYNFYGISGVFDDPQDEGRGVLEFKQGFNGYVEQLPGVFVLPVGAVRFTVAQMARTLLAGRH